MYKGLFYSLAAALMCCCRLPCAGQEYQDLTYLPPNISADLDHAPFIHGIASGDPLQDRVIIWTRITPDDLGSDTVIYADWVIASDEMLSEVLASGSFMTDSSRDFTIKVDVTGLDPDTYYYYGFIDADGNRSATGRTRTLPAGSLDRIQLGVASCSNIYYGFFNAYRSLARNDDIFGVIHLGDWIYNNNGRNSPIRIPEPEPFTLNENNPGRQWADRHSYYHLDEDLRAMLAAHPLIAVWDNHDMHNTNHLPAVKAWLDWVPVREDPSDFRKIYRKLSFGDLADLYMTDVRLYNDIDTLPGGELSFLGNDQFEWLTENIRNSDARWQLIGSQKNFATWNLGWVADLFNLNSPFFTTSNWDGRQESRRRLKSFFIEEAVDNVVFLTGDAHMGLLSDIDPDPYDNEFDYNKNTGEGSLGVEFLPSGVTGRNLDDRGVPLGLSNTVEAICMNVNPHQRYLNMVQNGYGVIDIQKDSLTAWICYNNIAAETDEEWCHGPFIVYNGANHWKRLNQSYQVLTAAEDNASIQFYLSDAFPNPARQKVSFTISIRDKVELELEILSVDGTDLSIMEMRQLDLERGHHRLDIDLSAYPSGIYLAVLRDETGSAIRKFARIQ